MLHTRVQHTMRFDCIACCDEHFASGLLVDGGAGRDTAVATGLYALAAPGSPLAICAVVRL